MPKLQIDDKTFYADFEYTSDIRATYCYIRESDPHSQPLLNGYTQCYYRDVPNKETARKVSFARAIAGFPKAYRRKLWNEFHRVRGKTRYIKHASYLPHTPHSSGL